MWARIRSWLRSSSHIHLAEAGPLNYRDLVALFDRFLDGATKYPLEWDDFVSWTNPNLNIEAIRLRIGEWEPLAFSSNTEERKRFVELLVDVRNKCAATVGIPPRSASDEA